MCVTYRERDSDKENEGLAELRLEIEFDFNGKMEYFLEAQEKSGKI